MKQQMTTNASISPDNIRELYGDFRKALLKRKTDIIKKSAEERASLSEQVLTAPGDVGDQAVIDTGADYFLTLADIDRRELLEITDAFNRMQRGVYGVCESCEGDVAVERLEKLPYARNCIDCQELAESKGRAGHPQRLKL
jgi:DnaK suppressor protein